MLARGRIVVASLAACLASFAIPLVSVVPASASAAFIVRGTSTDAVAAAVEANGGVVTKRLSIIDGVAASVPVGNVGSLASSEGVAAVTPDAHVRVLEDVPATTEPPAEAVEPAEAPDDISDDEINFVDPIENTDGVMGSESEEGENPDAPQDVPVPRSTRSVVAQAVRADRAWAQGVDGSGVTVALIDTGIADRADFSGRIQYVGHSGLLGLLFPPSPCVNISGEYGCNDSLGHGTFIAGLIAGDGSLSDGAYKGIAPEAKLLSLKIAGRDGSADVSKVIAALQWITVNKDRYSIDVVNLSLGTDSTQSYMYDPLNYAVERAWDSGIAVVVSAGNRGDQPGTISKPADDPFVITVGSIDDRTTPRLGDDTLPAFSSRGPTAEGIQKPEVVAPGALVWSLRSPGSEIETSFPSSSDNPYYRQGSGTSQSAGVVSGAVALVLDANPNMTPDQVKFTLMNSARPVASTNPNDVGSGMIDLERAALNPPQGSANQGIARSLGTGSLEASRGNLHVQLNNASQTVLNGELTAALTSGSVLSWFNTAFNGASWYGGSWYGGSWYGGSWYGTSWYGGSWYGGSWYGGSWYGEWDGASWYGTSWYGASWYGVWD